MAEIQTQTTADKKKRLIKKSTRVDLTPMVDLGFLLLTFFVFTTRLSEAKAMPLLMPNNSVISEGDKVCESCVLTVLLDKNNRVKYYEGAVENNPVVEEAGFAAGEIRSILMKKKADVEKARGSGDQFILIIKPSAASSFKNFVDMTDEVTISQVKRYYIDELKEADKKILGKDL